MILYVLNDKMSQNADEDVKADVESAPKMNSDAKSSVTTKERKSRKEKVKALAKVSRNCSLFIKWTILKRVSFLCNNVGYYSTSAADHV